MKVVCYRESYGFISGIGDIFWIESGLTPNENNYKARLTPGKQYDVLSNRDLGPLHQFAVLYPTSRSIKYLILNDDCDLLWYSSDLFKPLSEIRDEKLEELGI